MALKEAIKWLWPTSLDLNKDPNDLQECFAVLNADFFSIIQQRDDDVTDKIKGVYQLLQDFKVPSILSGFKTLENESQTILLDIRVLMKCSLLNEAHCIWVRDD